MKTRIKCAWPLVRLGEVVHLRSGHTPSKARAEYWGGRFPWISAKDLKRPRIGESIDCITDLAVTECATVVPRGTLVILVRGMTLLKDVPVALTTRDLAINQDIKGLVPADVVDPEFLLCVLTAKRSQLMRFVDRAGHGTGKLDTTRLLSLPVRLPALAEQRFVAGVGQRFDAVVSSVRRVLEAKRRLKRALLQQLLTGKGRAKARVVALADVVRLRSGNTPSKARPDYWDGNFPWISAKDLKRPRIGESIDSITSLAVKESATVVPPGTVVILVRGMMLLKDVPVAVTTRELAINQDIKGLEPSADIDSGFLLCLLAAKRSQLMGFVNRAGHGTGKLDTDRLLSLPLHLPPLAEQRNIAGAVELLDHEITLLDRQLTAYRQLKRGLMQKLLTGEHGAA